MGMDVYGKAPSSERGEYFRQSGWGWHPLWEFCEFLAPKIAGRVKYAHSNDGDGLNAAGAQALASAIDAAVLDGRAARYCFDEKQRLDGLADVPCTLCEGTGRRAQVPNPGAGTYGCNGCGGDYVNDVAGTGKVRPFETHYDTSVDEIAEFAAFLHDCGGFEIH